MVIWRVKQIGKVKKLDKWVPHELTENQKNHRFEVSSSLILCNDNKPLIKQIVICDKNWILYDNWQWPAQQLDQEIAPKHFPKSNLHQKNVMITDWQSTAHWSTTAFWIPKKPLTPVKYAQQIYDMHQNLQCLQVALINRNDPILHDNAQLHIAQPMLQKLKELGYEVFLSSITFTWPLAKRLLLLPASQQLFQGKCFHNQQEAENAFQEIVESQSMDFYVTGISKLISRWQNSIDFNGSYFD